MVFWSLSCEFERTVCSRKCSSKELMAFVLDDKYQNDMSCGIAEVIAFYWHYSLLKIDCFFNFAVYDLSHLTQWYCLYCKKRLNFFPQILQRNLGPYLRKIHKKKWGVKPINLKFLPFGYAIKKKSAWNVFFFISPLNLFVTLWILLQTP